MNDHDTRRAEAIERLEDKRDLRNHVLIYVAVNALLVVIWAASGASGFWPIWPIAGWGIGLAIHTWTVFGGRSFSEDEIRREEMREETRHTTM